MIPEEGKEGEAGMVERERESGKFECGVVDWRKVMGDYERESREKIFEDLSVSLSQRFLSFLASEL